MVATRVITDHNELDNSGTVPHSQLDELANLPFIVVSNEGKSFNNARRIVCNPGVSLDTSIPGVAAFTLRVIWLEVLALGFDKRTIKLSYAPAPPSSLMLFVNGALQRQGSDCDYVLDASTVVMNYSLDDRCNISATYPY